MTEETHGTILLVEDDSIMALAQKMSLQRCGYRVFTAHSGEKALMILEETVAIAMVLMDIDLGRGLDGPATALLMLEKRAIPILFLSNHTEQELVKLTCHIPHSSHLAKNRGIAVLDASIKSAFQLFKTKKLQDDSGCPTPVQGADRQLDRTEEPGPAAER